MQRDRLNRKNVRGALILATTLTVLAVVAFGLSVHLAAPAIFDIWRLLARITGILWFVLGLAVAVFGRGRRDVTLAAVSIVLGLALLLGSTVMTSIP